MRLVYGVGWDERSESQQALSKRTVLIVLLGFVALVPTYIKEPHLEALSFQKLTVMLRRLYHLQPVLWPLRIFLGFEYPQPYPELPVAVVRSDDKPPARRSG